MAEIGFFLSSEEQSGPAILRAAQQAEEVGFHSLLVSDHFHPWLDSQGQSPFVWSVIGAVAATTRLKVTTGVTCPIKRIHPVITAQAVATSATLLDGRFAFGVGSGENLNEHVTGASWPRVDIRLEMLEEAIQIMRELWTGKLTSFQGKYYDVDRARIYSLPDEPPPVIVSGFGPKAIEVAGKVGDGFITTEPEADAISQYRSAGGRGPTLAALKVCWAESEDTAAKTAHNLWRNELLPGELAQELPMPAHFEQASELVTEAQVRESMALGPDPEKHAKAITAYLEAGFDEVYVSQIGPDQQGFLDFYRREVRPRL